jgi:hypothetical protein
MIWSLLDLYSSSRLFQKIYLKSIKAVNGCDSKNGNPDYSPVPPKRNLKSSGAYQDLEYDKAVENYSQPNMQRSGKNQRIG